MKKILFISLFTMLISVSFVSAETSTTPDSPAAIEKSITVDSSTVVTADRSIGSDENATEESEASSDLPAWVNDVLAPVINFIKSIPKVGPVVVVILKIISVIAGILTALSAFLMAIARVLIVTGGWVGAQGFADKVESISNKILPWFKRLSMFNVQKNS